MDKQTKKMLKRILLIDRIIVILTLIISMIIIREYAFVIMIGLLMSITNFIVNAIVTYYAFTTAKKQIYNILGSACRVIVTTIVAVSLYNNDKYNLLAFIGGYILHYVAIVIYGITLKNEKGSD